MSDADYQPPEFPSFSSLQSQQLVKREQTTFTQHRLEQGTTPAPPIQTPVKQAIHAPAFKPPSFQAPSIPTPSIPAPAFKAPAYQAPSFQAPSFQPPSIPAPVKQTPVIPAPVPVVQPTVVRSAVSQLPQQMPPKFTKPVSTASLTEGEKLFLEAQYEGTCEVYSYHAFINLSQDYESKFSSEI